MELTELPFAPTMANAASLKKSQALKKKRGLHHQLNAQAFAYPNKCLHFVRAPVTFCTMPTGASLALFAVSLNQRIKTLLKGHLHPGPQRLPDLGLLRPLPGLLNPKEEVET
jgi:hypothetical protein